MPWPNIAYKIISAQEDKLLNFSSPNRITREIAVKSMCSPSLCHQSVHFLEAKDIKFKVRKHFSLMAAGSRGDVCNAFVRPKGSTICSLTVGLFQSINPC